jgi:hypothetical protein
VQQQAEPPILISGHGDIPVVVQAMKSGAFDFVQSVFASSDDRGRPGARQPELHSSPFTWLGFDSDLAVMAMQHALHDPDAAALEFFLDMQPGTRRRCPPVFAVPCRYASLIAAQADRTELMQVVARSRQESRHAAVRLARLRAHACFGLAEQQEKRANHN